MTSRVRFTVAGLTMLLVLTSCSSPLHRTANVPEPWCDNWGLLMLEAQSVPSAGLIPCVETLPLGWTAAPARVNNEGTSFVLDSSIAGDAAVTVELTERCDVADSIQVPSDVAAADRYEFVDEIVSGFSGRRTYVLDGACVVFTFDFDVEAAAALVSEVSLVVDFMPRAVIDEVIRSATDGREQLDPVPGS